MQKDSLTLFSVFEDFIELALLRKKLPEISDGIKRNIEATVLVCEQIMNSWSLKAFLRYVLHTGNFINHVSKTSTKFSDCCFFLFFF